jgi:methionyl-tRNA formyltransferase
MLRIIFMGTPVFAVPILRVLCESHNIVTVFTQPDRPAGRGRRIAASPVKQEALARGLSVLQPNSLRAPAVVAQVQAMQPNLIVVAAYGLILPQSVLDIPTRGCINVHASLLPRYRGASPIAGALLAGEHETGITLMLMEAGLDTGPILAQRSVRIAEDDNCGSLEKKLSQLGADLLRDTLPQWIHETVMPKPQDHERATLTRMIRKSEGQIKWAETAVDIVRRIRAFTPSPGAFANWNGQPLKLFNAIAREGVAEPGRVYKSASALHVGAGVGSVELLQLQLPGKLAMAASEFLRGHPELVGAKLGDVP